jgi:chromosome segregation ATPase
MFDDLDLYAGQSRREDRLAKLERLTQIRNELMELIQVRDRLVNELTTMKTRLQEHRHASTELRSRATELLERLIEKYQREGMTDQSLSVEDEQMLEEIDVSRIQLEHEVDDTDRRLRIAQFEADSLAMTLEDLELQVEQLAADLNSEDEEDYLTERH